MSHHRRWRLYESPSLVVSDCSADAAAKVHCSILVNYAAVEPASFSDSVLKCRGFARRNLKSIHGSLSRDGLDLLLTSSLPSFLSSAVFELF